MDGLTFVSNTIIQMMFLVCIFIIPIILVMLGFWIDEQHEIKIFCKECKNTFDCKWYDLKSGKICNCLYCGSYRISEVEGKPYSEREPLSPLQVNETVVVHHHYHDETDENQIVSADRYYCIDCDETFLSTDSIKTQAGIYPCPICAGDNTVQDTLKESQKKSKKQKWI